VAPSLAKKVANDPGVVPGYGIDWTIIRRCVSGVWQQSR
jgi:hypothetical protein